MQVLRLPVKGVSSARVVPASKHNVWSRVVGTRKMCRPVAFKEDDSKDEGLQKKIQQTPLQNMKDLANVASGVPTTDSEAPRFSWLTPAFTRRREVWISRIAMLGFFGLCIGEILTGKGPVGQLSLETGLSNQAVVSILTAFAAYNFVGGLNPWSATFSPENIKVSEASSSRPKDHGKPFGGSSRNRSSTAVACCAFCPETSKLYVGLESGEVRFWQLRAQSPGPGPLLLGVHKGVVGAICVPAATEGELGKAKLVVTGSQDATIKIWDYKGKILQEPSICVQTLHGHGGTVTALAVTGDYIISGSNDCTVRVWRAVGGRDALCYPWFDYVSTVATTEGWVRCMSLARSRKRKSSEGESLFVGDDSGGLIRIVIQGVVQPDTHLVGQDKEFKVKGRVASSNGTMLAIRKLHDRGISAIRHIPDEHLVITLAYDNTCRVYDMAAAVLKHSWTNENGCLFTAVEFAAQHHQVLTVDQAGFLAVYDLRHDALIATKRLVQGPLVGLCWALGADTLAALTPSEVQIWKIERDLDYDVVRGGHTKDVIAIAACSGPTSINPRPDYRIFSAGLDNTARLWDPYNMACLQVVEETDSELAAMTFSQLHNTLITGHENGAVKLWDLDTNQATTLKFHTNTVAAMALGAVRVADELLITVGFDGWLGLWDLRTSRTQHPYLLDKIRLFPGVPRGVSKGSSSSVPVAHVELPAQLDDRKEVLCVLYDPLKKTFITGGNDNRIRVWSLATKSALGSHTGHTDAVTCMALDANLVISGSEDCSLRVWDAVPGGLTAAKTQVFVGKALQVLQGHTQAVTGVAVLPATGRVLSCGLDGCLIFWDYLRGQSIHTFKHTWQFRCLALRHDAAEVLVGTSDGRLLRFPTEVSSRESSPAAQERSSGSEGFEEEEEGYGEQEEVELAPVHRFQSQLRRRDAVVGLGLGLGGS